MNLNEVLSQYLTLFETYFKICESLDGVETDVPKTSAYEKSVVATNYVNLQDYIDSIQLPAYKNEASDVLFSSFRNIFASAKSAIELNRPYLDPTILSPELVNNLLRSFGFDYLDLPMISKRRILSSLVKAYRIKGSINSILEITQSVINNYNVKELWLKKDYEVDSRGRTFTDIYFEWKSDKVEVPGGESEVINKLPYEYVVDEHWWIDKQKVIDTCVTRQMSPFYVVHKTTNSTNLYKGIALFKKVVYDDYNTYLNDPDNYPDRRVITVESLPESFSHLELWYMIRYFWIYINYYTFIDDNGRNYFHVDYPFITKEDLQQEYEENFETRYDTPADSIEGKYKLTIDPTYIHAVISKINDSEVYRFTQQRYGATVVPYQNKIIILFGKDSSGNELNSITVINPGKPGEENTVYTPFWLEDFQAYTYGNYVVISGGKYQDGTKNENVYVIDLDTEKIYITNTRNIDLETNPTKFSVYNPYGKVNYLVTFRTGRPSGTMKFYEVYGVDSFPYLVKEFDDVTEVEIFSYNLASNVLISFIGTTGGEEPVSGRIFYLYSTRTKEEKIITSLDYPEFDFLFDPNSTLYCFPYGSGFVIMYIDNDKNIRQIFFETDDTESVSTTILTEYVQYPNNPNYAYKVNADDYYSSMTLNQITTPNGSVLFSNDPVDILYHLKELKIDKLRYQEEVEDYYCNDNIARCFRETLLTLREERLILDDSVLPKFATVSELRDFLMSLTPTNIESFEKSPYKELILFELLVTASQVTGVDLTSLMTGYLTRTVKEIVERFKPVYSRLIDLTSQMVIADPVGDWLAFADGKPHIVISKHFNDEIPLNDYLRLNLEKNLISELKMSDDFVINLVTKFAMYFFDGNITGDLHESLYLDGLTKTWTFGSKALAQQYITTTVDTGL